MGVTPTYNLDYFDPYEAVGGDLDMDERRFRTIDNQLLHLFSIFGNGVLDPDPTNPSWYIEPVLGNTTGAVVQITPGQGNIGFMAGSSTSLTQVSLPLPPGGSYPATFYLYATPTDQTPAYGTVSFVAFTTVVNQPDTYIGLGSVDVSVDNLGNINMTCHNDAAHGRVDISVFAMIAAIVNAHVHIGGTNEPSRINLGLHVQGLLDGSFLTNIDASSITTGTFNANLLPQLSHDSLTRIGTLTHPEIDSLLLPIVVPGGQRLADIDAANTLRIVNLLKRQTSLGLGNFGSTLLNSIYYVPGVSADSFAAYYSTYATAGLSGIATPYVPTSVTLATIDKTNKQITGTNAAATGDDAIVWTTDLDWDYALSSASSRTISNVPPSTPASLVVVGTGSGSYLTLAQPLKYTPVIPSNDLTKFLVGWNWTDTSVTEGGPPVNDFHDGYTARRYFWLPFSSTQDWSQTQNILIGYGISSGAEMGDLYCYLILAEGGTTTLNVRQVSAPSTLATLSVGNVVQLRSNGDANNARTFIAKSLLEFATEDQLPQVAGIGFYWDTSTGWDSAVLDFTLVSPTANDISAALNTDSATVVASIIAAREASPTPDTVSTAFRWNETQYTESATLVFRFDSNFATTQYNIVSWTSESVGAGTAPNITVAVRTALTEDTLGSTYAATSGSTIPSEARVGQYFDVIVSFLASQDLKSAPALEDLHLYFSGPGASTTKTWTDTADWSTAEDTYNLTAGANQTIDSHVVNELSLTSYDQVGRYTYARTDGVYTAFQANGSDESVLIDTSALYPTPAQTFAGGAIIGFTSPRAVEMTASGNYLIADTGGDRILEMTLGGALVRAIQGNIRLRRTQCDLVALGTYYNARTGILYITFSQNISVADRTKMTLIGGTNQLRLDDASTNVVLSGPLNGKSATLECQMTSATMATIASWPQPLVLALVAGCVSGSVGVSSDGTPGTPTSGSSGSGSTTYTPNGTSLNPTVSSSSLFSFDASGSFAGTVTDNVGLPVASSTTAVAGDFNGDGVVDPLTLLGPHGETNSFQMTVYNLDITFDTLFEPNSIQELTSISDGTWLTGAVGSDTAIAYANDSTRLWSIPTTVAAMQEGLGGSAYQIGNGNVVFALPAPTLESTQGSMLVVNRTAGNVVVVNLAIQGDVVRAIPASDGVSYWCAIDDRVGGGYNSRLERRTVDGNVAYSWGSNLLVHPLGLRVLANGQLLVSD